ncbi:MAG: hypothetical protein EA364_09415 [Balneolaceae bacterium]|nr:MAG: hypothetical protein EA364_09415 [Balneolaceae bacterium]
MGLFRVFYNHLAVQEGLLRAFLFFVIKQTLEQVVTRFPVREIPFVLAVRTSPQIHYFTPLQSE